ncbi:MAG: hypothetical protein JWQ97_4067 [Phenylobacterium sp.]|nr:hypothetical protein [Phenylobacterium sp.]
MIPPHAARFFAALRSGLLGPRLSPDEVSGCTAILEACTGWPTCWTAYALATAYHETAHTMQPVKEYGGEAYFTRMYDPTGLRPEVARELGNIEPGDGIQFCGRGYVQLTGRTNYARCGIADDPDKALEPKVAAQILEQGMREGSFTGRKLMDFLLMHGPATRAQFMAARWVINRQDKADLIADYAMRFQDALMAGGCT